LFSQVLESWMIRLEKDSSQMRQQTQLLEIGYKEQIKACFEILQRCTRPEPNWSLGLLQMPVRYVHTYRDNILDIFTICKIAT